MLSILTTLLEIAMALRHMHSMQLVHCDLKVSVHMCVCVCVCSCSWCTVN